MDDRFILTPYFLDDPQPKLETLADRDWLINQLDLPSTNQQDRMSWLHESLANQISEVLESGGRPVSVAGDCCSAIGFTAGLQRAGLDPFLVWFDAHGDFNTWETTPSRFLGGMPLAMLVGRGEQTMPEAVGLRSLAEERVLLTDGRDLDPGEREAVEGSEVHHLKRVEELLDFPFPHEPIHVHFDVDILNPNEASAVSYPASGGPSISDLEEVFKTLAESGKVQAVSVSTWNPDLDVDDETSRVCMMLLAVLLGGDRSRTNV